MQPKSLIGNITNIPISFNQLQNRTRKTKNNEPHNLTANQRLVLKEDARIKDPERHTGDSNTRFQSNNRKA